MNANSVADLLTKKPGLQSPIAGYHVLAGVHPSSSLTPGATLLTVDVMRTPGQPDSPVNITVAAPLQVRVPLQRAVLRAAAIVCAPQHAAVDPEYAAVLECWQWRHQRARHLCTTGLDRR